MGHTYPEVVFPTQADWSDFIRSDIGTERIQWTPNSVEYNGKVMRGAVRARLNDQMPWGYRECGDATRAFGWGVVIIGEQRKMRKHLNNSYC